MKYVYENEPYVPCELEEAKVLFSTNSPMVFIVNKVFRANEGNRYTPTVSCTPSGEDFGYLFREHELGIFGLHPCKPSDCVFKFKLESLSFDDLTKLIADQKGLKWGDNHAVWAIVPTDDTALGNIDFQFQDTTFKATLDKP